MNTNNLTAVTLRPYLELCGYTGPRLASEYKFDDGTAPLVGFSGKPWDVRSACIAAVDVDSDSRASANKYRTLGAPTVLVCGREGLDCWRMGPDGAAEEKHVAAKDFDRFFDLHRRDLSPKSIYNAKMLRPAAADRQMWFVDAGLMPAVERRAGETLHRLVEQSIQGLALALGSRLRSRKGYIDLYKTVFWLLAAKLLHEKNVENFRRIDLEDVDDVFVRVGRHYADIDSLPPGGQQWRPAIDAAAAKIATWGYLGNISTEALGYLYERALIDKKPTGRGAKNLPKGRDIRKELGIHSTPPVLVDHMLAQLWPMIEEISPQDRSVFEPACGHGAFLVASLRWLREHSELEEGIERHRYLRDRLYGIEKDAFARELGKLSLTLADVPHGNSWHIHKNDMFLPNVLCNATKRCTVLLANPPYERFSESDRARYRKAGEPVTAITKAVEMLRRTLPHLQPGGVFGVVMPQGVLHDKESIEMRKLLLSDFELSEISLFADNLFEESDHEVAVLMGRRRKPTASTKLMYRRVREHGMEAFKEHLAFSSSEFIDSSRFLRSDRADLRLPDLRAVWDGMSERPMLRAVAKIGQGLFHKGRNLPKGSWTVHDPPRCRDPLGYATVASDLVTYEAPRPIGLNTDPRVVDRFVAGAASNNPRILFNYGPVSRRSWRIKAFIDPKGLAATSRFVVVTPIEGSVSMLAIWAMLNSPVANAYAYCHLMKRDILVGTMRKLPIPTVKPARFRAVESSASAYLQLAGKKGTFMSVEPTDSEVRAALVRMDAEVMKLYDLPPRLEYQLLDSFKGEERKGVGCKFRGYYPPSLDAYVPLHELISEDYARSTLGAFREHPPLDPSSPVLAALRSAAEAFAEE